MAKRKINKSKAVREYLTANPNAMPKDVAEAPRAQGVKVGTNMISTIKYTMRKGGGSAAAAASHTGEVSLSNLMRAMRFIERVGGAEKAKAIVAVVDKLR